MKYLMQAAIVAAALAGGTAASAVELITNGGFEDTNVTDSTQFGARYSTTIVTGWDADGLTNVYFPGTAERGATTEYGYRDMKIYGPANGFNNGLPATSPAGGNFVMLDGDPTNGIRGSLSQDVTGIMDGKRYRLTFWFAGAQQYPYPGATTDKYLDVSFAGKTQRTEVLGGPEGSFQPWRKVSMIFTGATMNDTVSFLAHGLPVGQPPLVLIDGVSMQAVVPEPATWAMLIAGFGLVGASARRRRPAVAA